MISTPRQGQKGLWPAGGKGRLCGRDHDGVTTGRILP